MPKINSKTSNNNLLKQNMKKIQKKVIYLFNFNNCATKNVIFFKMKNELRMVGIYA